MDKIYNECCLDTMSRLADKSVKLTITSPPYNMNLRIRNGKYCSCQIVDHEFSTKYKGFADNLPIDDFYSMHKEILTEIIRVSELTFYNFQLVTGSKRAFFKLIGDFNEEIKEIIIWDKFFGQPAMQHHVMNSRYEFILVLGDNPISRQFTASNFERGLMDNLWTIKRERERKGKEEHGATFPQELIAKIINNFSKENDLIYDPFLGTGTTASVAKKLNRRYLGSEISDHYYMTSLNRIENTK